MHTKTLASAIGIALLGATFQVPATTAGHSAQAEARQSYIIKFAETGLLHYAGGVQGIAATAPASVGTRKLDAHTPAAIAYSQYLQDQRAAYISAIGQKLGGQVSATHQYGVTMNGVAMELTASEAAKVASVPGVVSIKPAGTYELDTYRGPAYIGADKIWDGTSTPTGVGTQGEGILAAIIDGGTNSDHPSFADDATCGFSGANPKLTAYDCSSTDGTGACNGPDPEANPTFGHGVHTSSTVAGNTIDNTAVPPPALPDGRTMSGVAPCAAIVQFKACPSNTCGGAALAAGIENSIVAGADVLNYSISGGTSPWNDLDRAFLDAVDADIFVAASAGNTNDTITDPVGQVNHRGPWVMTVAASTQDELIGPSISLSGPGTPPAGTSDIPMIPGDTTTSSPELVDKPIKTYPANVEGCTASGGIAAGTFTGSIALLSRGTCAFTEKITNATNAGADMVVIYNNTGVIPIAMSTPGAPPTPAFGIAMADGLALSAFIDANPASATADTVAIAGGTLQGDVLADFSFRGPTPAPLADLQKPDITAPGLLIYAGDDDASGNYSFKSGTSMSSPHTAGAGALIRAVHPDWTVPEVKSALQTTAKSGGFQEDGVTSWNIDDVGSGRVQVDQAALAGLTLDETFANFLAANPAGGGDVKELNLAALRNLSCTPDCTWTRTVTNKLDTAGTWDTSFSVFSGSITATASPANFTLAPGASQVVTITAAPPAGVEMTEIGFGNLIFTEANGLAPDQHFTVAISGESGEPNEDIIFQSDFDGAPGSFSENWDSYATDSQAHGQGGWKGWANDPVAGAFVVDTQSVSTPNSIEIAGASDLIHEFDYDSGAWTVTAKQYIPSSFSGQSYFIFQNVYNDEQVGLSWSTQVIFDSATGMVSNEATGADQGSTPFVTDQWADLRLDIDLDADTQTFSYNGTVVYSGSWSNQFPNQTTPGITEIGAIDLFANGATEVYYDDIQIAPAKP
jgi:subtilisin family serine protease